MTAESRLYTFIDGARQYALYFLEGQKLIEDLALIHPMRPAGFAYFRDVVLSVQPMVALIKSGEQFGFYIDSTEPHFRLKIETAHYGTTRCMLLPEGFGEFPQAMHGLVRLHKVFPHSPPYESVLEVEGLPLGEIVNRVLDRSYQVRCAMLLSEVVDQSMMLHQLPPLAGREEYEFSAEALRGRHAEIRERLRGIFARALHERDAIEAAFAEVGFRLLADRPIRFACGCDRERMIENLVPLWGQHGERLFEGDAALDVVCEYCKTHYRVERSDLRRAPGRTH